MKIKAARRVAGSALEGITLTAVEEKAAMERAEALAGLPHESFGVLVRAIGERIIALIDAEGWTTPGSSQEQERLEQLTEAVILARAVDLARTGFQILRRPQRRLAEHPTDTSRT